MADEYLFVSDCHLDVNRQDITTEFIRFLQNRAIKAQFLYILGDLFDTWIGDDDLALTHTKLFRCLKSLSRNTQIFFLVGNRDFLLGKRTASQMGAKLIQEPIVLSLGNRKIGLLHGDILCTDDTDYQQFRKKVRTPNWQDNFLAKPFAERKQIAADLRQQSKTAMQHKTSNITDVNEQTVLQQFVELDVNCIIHGHTHRPATHHYKNNLTRFVLGDWNPQPSYLSWREDQGFVLIDYRVR